MTELIVVVGVIVFLALTPQMKKLSGSADFDGWRVALKSRHRTVQRNSATGWLPLSERDATRLTEALYEGVPLHLRDPLTNWLGRMLLKDAGRHLSSFTVESDQKALRVANKLRLRLPAGDDSPSTQREGRYAWQLMEYARQANGKRLLNVVDAVLMDSVNDPIGPGTHDLDILLKEGGSAYCVNSSGAGLVRRADPSVTTAYNRAISPHDAASVELKEAWNAVYGRNPDASDAWDHAIKAVEHLLIPIVVPVDRQGKATLGQVLKLLEEKSGDWRLVLHGNDNSKSVAPLISMLRLIWPNPDRHGGSNQRQPSLAESQAVVHLTITIVQWGRDHILIPLPLPRSERTGKERNAGRLQPGRAETGA
jgi:hypothetical protein